jgi:hypothetical protein
MCNELKGMRKEVVVVVQYDAVSQHLPGSNYEKLSE